MNANVHKLSLSRSVFEKFNQTNTGQSKSEVQNQLQIFARSTKIEIDGETGRLLLCGSDLTHHQADPCLIENKDTLPFPIDKENYAECHLSLPNYDFCMEDSWSGFFVAKQMRKYSDDESIVFIHLDDHTDMMSTLLLTKEDELIDSRNDAIFNPRDTEDWINAIEGGAVGIGSFVTALYYLKQSFHVLHLNHAYESPNQLFVKPKTITHPLLPLANFATIEKGTQFSPNQLGTYSAAKTASGLFKNIPPGRVIVHIDLDYFINDYNGNIGAIPEGTIESRRENALLLIADFFDSLKRKEIDVDRFIIASSPGFCSSIHWRWLLNQIEQRL
ncbi:MAG: hypothetical protein ACPG52_00505 [Cognaticolwellia sp.]